MRLDNVSTLSDDLRIILKCDLKPLDCLVDGDAPAESGVGGGRDGSGVSWR